jgi:cytochrome oxidase Cu insertion factor (SCO1/SenC/PrrC family)
MQKSLLPSELFLTAALMASAFLGVGQMVSASGQFSAPVAPLNIAVGQKAPNFLLPSAEGKTVKLSDYAGHIVLIDFYRGYW